MCIRAVGLMARMLLFSLNEDMLLYRNSFFVSEIDRQCQLPGFSTIPITNIRKKNRKVKYKMKVKRI